MSQQERNTVVLGPPGTGKTTTIRKYVARGADMFGPERVLVTSLTRTAAAELIREGLPIPRGNVGTLHAICYRELGRPQLVYPTFPEFNEKYGYSLVDENTKSVDDLEVVEAYDKGIYSAYDMYRMKMVPRKLWMPDVQRLARDLEEWKQTTGTIDFTDMIARAVDEIPQPSCAPKAIFYDEAQDGSPLEFELIRRWSAKTDHTIVAGDDDQCLYAFRGASVGAFLGFSSKHIQLPLTHRLPENIRAYAQRYAEQITEREAKVFKSKYIGGVVDRLPLSVKSDDCRALAAAAWDRAKSGKTVMILTTCGYMLTPLINALRFDGIPFHNPFRVKRGDWNPLKRGGKNISATDRVIAFMDQTYTWKEVYKWASILKARGTIKPGFKSQLEEKKDLPFEIDWASFKEIFEEGVLQHITFADLPWLRDSILATRSKVMSFPLKIAELHGKETLKQQPRIIVGTVHSVKGGEADCVFLMPDLSASGFSEYKGTSKQRDNVLRTMYVGMTRAKEELVLCRNSSGMRVEWI